MNQEKPLHVQVAEALGWTDISDYDPIFGNRGLPPKHLRTPWGYVDLLSGKPIRDMDICNVPRYDTDWSAGGPLFDKYVLFAHHHPSGWTVVAHDPSFAAQDPAGLLSATCHLILALKQAGKTVTNS
jgi:hypothetical protein